MNKTGEAYTAARAQILKKSRAAKTASAPVAPTPSNPAPNYAKLAGMSDATIKEKTGCTWDRWVFALDRLGAEKMTHREIADLVFKKYKVDGWWSQTVTVGYERIKGLRAKGQRRDGSYEASKSRTFNVPVGRLFDAWTDTSVRRRWLNEPGVRIRTATKPKSIRLGHSDGRIVAVWFTPKGDTKSSVAVTHAKLPDPETANILKQYWTERLDALGEVLVDVRPESEDERR
jgi:hypothetical protein